MKHFNKRMLAVTFITVCAFLFSLQGVQAQTPVDAKMMTMGQMCAAAMYTHESWNHYWEGTLLRENGNIGTLNRHTINPGFALGVYHRINVLASFPYVITSPTGGYVQGDHNFQNFELWVKGEIYNQTLGPGRLHLLATAGFSTPLTHYLPNYPYSIGMGCTEGSLRGIAQYDYKRFYVRGQFGYDLRGTCTLQQSYYYTTQGYYTNTVDVPNAIDYGGVFGFQTSDGQILAELNYDGLTTLGGFDIRRQDVGFPSNKIIYNKVGANFEYYPKQVKGLGLHVNGGYVVSGRNTGQSTVIGGGVTYYFNVWKPKK